MPFKWALERRKTQTASSRIWTRVTDSISFDDNRYIKSALFYVCTRGCSIHNMLIFKSPSRLLMWLFLQIDMQIYFLENS